MFLFVGFSFSGLVSLKFLPLQNP